MEAESALTRPLSVACTLFRIRQLALRRVCGAYWPPTSSAALTPGALVRLPLCARVTAGEIPPDFLGTDRRSGAAPAAADGSKLVVRTAWQELCALAKAFPAFQGLPDSMRQHAQVWEDFLKDPTLDPAPLPLSDDQKDDLNGLRMLMLVRCVRAEAFVACARHYVRAHLPAAPRFLTPAGRPTLREWYMDRAPEGPILLLCRDARGVADGFRELYTAAAAMPIPCASYSPAPGAVHATLASIAEALQKPIWVLLCTADAAVAAAALDRLDEAQKAGNVDPDARLWLVLRAGDRPPRSIAAQCLRVACVPPVAVPAAAVRAQGALVEPCLAGLPGDDAPALAALAAPLCRLHAIVALRPAFGQSGWASAPDWGLWELDSAVRFLWRVHREDPSAGPGPGAQSLPRLLQLFTTRVAYGGLTVGPADRLRLSALAQRLLVDGDWPADAEESPGGAAAWGTPAEAVGLHARSTLARDTLASLATLQDFAAMDPRPCAHAAAPPVAPPPPQRRPPSRHAEGLCDDAASVAASLLKQLPQMGPRAGEVLQTQFRALNFEGCLRGVPAHYRREDALHCVFLQVLGPIVASRDRGLGGNVVEGALAPGLCFSLFSLRTALLGRRSTAPHRVFELQPLSVNCHSLAVNGQKFVR